MGSVFLVSIVAGLNPVLGRGYRAWWLGYVMRVAVGLFAMGVLVANPGAKLLDLFPVMIISNLVVSVVNVTIESAATNRKQSPREAYGLFLGVLLGMGLLGISILLRFFMLHSD